MGPPSTIVAALAAAATARPTGWAVRDPASALSYPELLARAEQEAASLARMGIGAGDLVLAHAVHRVDYLVTYFACLSLGVRLMPADPGAVPAEIDREINRYGIAYRIVPGTPASPAEVSPTGLTAVPAAEAGAQVLLPTSGTSGQPKRAVHHERSLLANARAHAESVGLSEADTCLLSLSPAFGYCHTAQVLATVLTNGRLVFPPRPAHPAEIGRVAADAGVTTTTMVPQQVTAPMARALGSVGTLRQLVLGGSAVRPASADLIATALPGVCMVQTWGMTEAGPRLTTWTAARDAARPGSVGRAVAGVEIVAADPAGRIRAPWADPGWLVASGELVARTPYLMSGYLDAAAETAAVVLGPDVLRTGDLGAVDPDGYVYVTGRVKNLIDVGGKKVAPEEIESVLLQFAGVAEAKVVAQQDERRGEVPAALLVAVSGVAIDAAAVQAYARGQLARHKWPVRIDVVDRIDRTVNGKIRRW